MSMTVCVCLFLGRVVLPRGGPLPPPNHPALQRQVQSARQREPDPAPAGTAAEVCPVPHRRAGRSRPQTDPAHRPENPRRAVEPFPFK